MSTTSVGAADAPDFRLLFEAGPGLQLLLTPDLIIVAASDAYLRSTMTRRETVVGRWLFDIFPENRSTSEALGGNSLRASLDRVIQDRVADAMPIIQYDIRSPDAPHGDYERRFWSPINTPIFNPDGSLAYILNRVEDVTDFVRLKRQHQEEHQATAMLREEAERMEVDIYLRSQEVAETNRRLETSNATLSRVQAAKDHLTGMVIHDLRNPLTACLGYLGVAEAKDRLLDPVLTRYLNGAREAGSRLLDMINGMVDIIRMEDEKMPVTIAWVDITALVAAKLQQYQGTATRSDLSLEHHRASDPITFATDGALLGRVVDNLIVNALKHTPQGGAVTVAAETSNTDGALVLRVSDTGEGIAPADLGRLFQKYGRGQGQTMGRQYDTGLGLVFCRMVIELLHGSLGVESEVGKGSTFTIKLPAASTLG